MVKSLTGGQKTGAMRSRFEPKPIAGMRLEERDEELLCDLFLHRLMSRGQLESLYFSSSVRANARLRLLFDHKFVHRFYPPAAPFGAQALYSVGPAALPVVAKRLEKALPEVRRLYRRTKTPTFIEHTLAITDFRLALLRSLKERPDLVLEAWLAEMQCRDEWQDRTSASADVWRSHAFKPDAFFRLAQPGEEELLDFFLEIDLGHTSARQFEGKLTTHQEYLRSGMFEKVYANSTFRTLVVTTGEKRLKNLLALSGKHTEKLFGFATFQQVEASGVLSDIWQEST